MSDSSVSSVVEPPEPACSPTSTRIVCPNCRLQLPLHTPVATELPAVWRCSRCGSHHGGVLLREFSNNSLPDVVLASQYFDCHPATLVHDWADSLVEHLHLHERHAATKEKRETPRVARNLHAQVIAVDDTWSPRGKSFPVIVYNISTGGLAYVSATINRSPLLAIQLATGCNMQVVAQSIWARPQFGGLFSVGVKFLCRLGNLTA